MEIRVTRHFTVFLSLVTSVVALIIVIMYSTVAYCFNEIVKYYHPVRGNKS